MSQKFDHWVHNFTVTDSQTHKKGYTIYKITSIIFPRNLPQALSCLTVWKRFHEVKKLCRDVQKKHKSNKLLGKVPEPKDFSYFKRFESDVIDNRKSYIVELLDFIAQHPVLYKSEHFVQFFDNGQSPGGVSPAHIASFESFKDSNDHEDEIDSKIMVESFIKEVAEKAVESQEKRLEERKNDFIKILTPMASFEDYDADYIYEAALLFSKAVQSEVLLEYQEAYDKYKAGVERLIKGTKSEFFE
ncbi:RPS6KC1.2 family protein [Megaselia abdita]